MPNKSEAAFLKSKFIHLDFILENGVIKNNRIRQNKHKEFFTLDKGEEFDLSFYQLLSEKLPFNYSCG